MNDPGRINILFLIDNFFGQGAGTEKHLYYLTSRIDKKRFNPIIVFFEGNRYYVDLLKNEGVSVINIPLIKIYEPNALPRAFNLARLIKKNKIDIVQTYHYKSDTFGVFIAKLSGVPIIISSRRDTGELKTHRQIMLNKIMNRFIDNYIMVCDNVGRLFRDIEGIPQQKMTTIYNGVDLQRFCGGIREDNEVVRNELGIDKDTFVIGSTAIFRPEKGFDVFLEGIKKVNPYIRNLKVLLMGFGDMEEYCINFCKQNGLDRVVKFMGYTDEVEKYLSIMDVFCLVPKKNEGLSNAILEAVAMGKPVIASDVGGNAELVVNKETGIIIPPDDPESFAKAILSMYENQGLRTEMGKKARKRSEEKFSLDDMVRNHEDYYERIFRA